MLVKRNKITQRILEEINLIFGLLRTQVPQISIYFKI